MTRVQWRLAGLSAIAAACVSCAASEAGEFSKSSWTISDARCPAGCSEEIRSFIRSYVGQSVRLSTDVVEAPFLDHCDGLVHLELRTSSSQVLEKELQAAADPTHPLPASALKLDGRGPVRNAVAYCKSALTDLPILRILAIEPHRILLLFEQQSIFELR